jgi:hypothetical protein
MPASTNWKKSSFSEGPQTSCVEVAWRKSSFSQGSGSSCVEVAFEEEDAAVRDSKNTSGPVLTVPGGAWRQALRSVIMVQAPR